MNWKHELVERHTPTLHSCKRQQYRCIQYNGNGKVLLYHFWSLSTIISQNKLIRLFHIEGCICKLDVYVLMHDVANRLIITRDVCFELESVYFLPFIFYYVFNILIMYFTRILRKVFVRDQTLCTSFLKKKKILPKLNVCI